MTRKISIATLIVLLVLGALAGVKFLQIRTLMASAKAMAAPPETIASAIVREERWQDSLTAIASVTAAQGVTITPDIPGTVQEIAFESGVGVSKGDLLVRLDTSTEQAQLRAVEAQLELASVNLKRALTLERDRMIPVSELDTAKATVKQYQADADTIRATIEKKTIRAPFPGRLGIRQVNLGQYLDTGKPIVSLQSLSPIYADFSLPQQELARLKSGMPARLTTDAYPGRQFEGSLTAINPDLDVTTRSVKLQATFENADHALRPGMFARVEVLLPTDEKVVVVPATAILPAPYGDSVYVIEPSSTNAAGAPGLVVRQQFVRTGQARGDFLSIESGLKPGEKVASAGVFKLRNGMSVVENNELTPKASETPRPSDT